MVGAVFDDLLGLSVQVLSGFNEPIIQRIELILKYNLLILLFGR